MSTTGSAQVRGDLARDEVTIADLDASTGSYRSGPDDAVVVRYYSDEALLAATQCRCLPPSDS